MDLKTLRAKAVEFFIQEEVLKFGDFTLKSGRKSPYFFNTGSLSNSRQLKRLGELYAERLLVEKTFDNADAVFGSAYKGIPISVATAIALAGSDRWNIRAVSDRKEAKTHGDTGSFLGVLKPGDKVAIVDDVITTGGTKVEAIEKLRAFGCEPLGFIIAFDRAEPIQGETMTAKESFEKSTGLPVYSLADVNDIVAVNPKFEGVLKEYLAGV